ncbi:MAG: GNAT family N-acetyltransferase [Verrucomicrobiales bacterium]|nr:GNAT family N-acetyltransferase [Verrucomicrobiales bacterium]
MKKSYHVSPVAWNTDRNRILLVRRKVFIEEQGVSESLEMDEKDASAFHLLALNEEDLPIGTARLSKDGRIGRVSVLIEWRKAGVGRCLMHALIREARGRKLRRVYLHAQTRTLGFYRKLGFSPRGEEFEEAGIPHFEMILHL